MEKREQDILKKIEEKTEEIKVPDSLMPEQIEKLLEEKGVQKKSRIKKIYRYGSLAAACVALAAGIFLAGQFGGETPEDMDAAEVKAVEEQDTEETEENTDTYEKIYAYLKERETEAEEERGFFDTFRDSITSGGADTAKETKMEESVAEDMSVAQSAADGGSYSKTNVRQQGVDEGDIVKTDGRYLYVLEDGSQCIAIVDTKGGLKKVADIEAEENCRIQEFYLFEEEKKLVYAGTVYEQNNHWEDTTKKGGIEEDVLYIGQDLLNGRESTKAVAVDIKNPEEPKEVGGISQSGSYVSSRAAGGYLYLFSRYNVWGKAIEGNPRTFIPMAGGDLLREKDIVLPPFETASMYEVITAVNIESPSEISDSRAIFTDGGELYVSNENIYCYETQWNSGVTETTSIRKIGYKDGKFSRAVKGKVKGYINDSFSIDEYGGNLRVVATVGETNSVYVLDKKLDVIGSIKGLAEDERVYSARFMGDVGYFVTFRETDPLFTVDLSDPKRPKIIGKLKIPGFSDYLHFYGENRLLGIGMSVDEDTQVTDGVKLSMFDLSDKTDVKEENKLVLKNVYSTDVSYDYKAALVDPGKNLIGFAAGTEGGEKYFLFGYDEKKGFRCHLSERINGSSPNAARGVYIEEVLYVARGNVIEGYSLKDYKKVDDIIL